MSKKTGNFTSILKQKYLFSALILISVIIILLLINLDSILPMAYRVIGKYNSKSTPHTKQEINQVKITISFSNTKIWENIKKSYSDSSYQNNGRQKFYRPGNIVVITSPRSFSFKSIHNKEYTVNMDETTEYYLPTGYFKDGVEQWGFQLAQMPKEFARDFITKDSEILLEVENPDDFENKKEIKAATILFANSTSEK